MHGVMLLDHFDARAAVFGDLVDVGTLREPQAYISVSEAVGCTAVAVAVGFKLFLVQDRVQEFTLIAWKEPVCRLGTRRAVEQ